MIELPPPDPYVEINLASRGISKGLAQTDGPQVEIVGGVSLGAFSVDGYGKNVESSGDEGVEWGASIGFQREAVGIEFSANIGFKALAGIATADRTALEVEAEASRSFGPVGASASVVYSADDTGSTRQALFVEAELTLDVAEGVQVATALGRVSAKVHRITRPSTSASRMRRSRMLPSIFGITAPIGATRARSSSQDWSLRSAPVSDRFNAMNQVHSFMNPWPSTDGQR